MMNEDDPYPTTQALASAPQRVGSRELKTRLGTYLRLVQAGARLIVTDRGRPVAELRPLEPEAQSLEERLEELARLGVLSRVRNRGPLEYLEPVVNRGASVSEAVTEDREDRC